MKAPSKEQLLADVLSTLTWSQIAAKYGYTDSRFLRKLAQRYNLPTLWNNCLMYKLFFYRGTSHNDRLFFVSLRH